MHFYCILFLLQLLITVITQNDLIWHLPTVDSDFLLCALLKALGFTSGGALKKYQACLITFSTSHSSRVMRLPLTLLQCADSVNKSGIHLRLFWTLTRWPDGGIATVRESSWSLVSFCCKYEHYISSSLLCELWY